MTESVKPSLVFFGSGPVAAASLEMLLGSFNFEAVVTKATTEQELRAVTKDIPVYSVSDKQELDALFTTVKFTSSCALLIDFGIILSNNVIDVFEHGIINSHFSLLPELRGADPISFAILEGKKRTGVSLMMLVAAMDEGPLLAQFSHELNGNETTPLLTNVLVGLSSNELKRIVPLWLKREIIPVPQDVFSAKNSTAPSYTRKLNKSDGLIDWNKPAFQIEREIRAYAEWPKSTTKLANVDCIITRSTVVNIEGEVSKFFIQDKELGIHCGQQSLIINSLKPTGKKEMSSTAFLAGYRTRLGL